MSSGGASWVLIEHQPLERLGAVLYALDRAGRWEEGQIVVGADHASAAALRLAAFADPPSVWSADGTRVTREPAPSLTEAARAAGRPVVVDLAALSRVATPGARSDVEALVEVIRERHPELMVEPTGDAVAFTYLGLEVARLEAREGQPRFEVGVGEHDQDARRTVVGHRAIAEEARRADLVDLEHAVDVVRRHRRVDAPPHPLKRLRRARWLRALVIDDPTRASLGEDSVLVPVDDLGATRSLRVDPPAPAVSRGEVVVCSAGIDLGLVPAAAAVWLQASEPDAWPRLTLVVPPRDDHPFTRTLVARLVGEARARLVRVPLTEITVHPA